MPLVRLTSTKKEVSADFEKTFSDFIEGLFPDKPLSVFLLMSLNTRIYNTPRCPTGTEDMVLCEIQSMFIFTPDNVESTREFITDFLSEAMGVEKNRILVVLTDVPTKYAGLGK